MLCKRGLCRHAVSVCLCESVTFVDSVETSKHIFTFFHRRIATPFLFFRTKRHGKISTGTPPQCRWDRQKITILSQYLASLRSVNAANGQLLSVRRRRTTVPQVVTLIAGSKRWSLLMAGDDDDEMFMTRSFNVKPKTTEQHFTARSNKSVAYVTNNKSLRSGFCTIEANDWRTWSIARPLCDSRATCFRTEPDSLPIRWCK